MELFFDVVEQIFFSSILHFSSQRENDIFHINASLLKMYLWLKSTVILSVYY